MQLNDENLGSAQQDACPAFRQACLDAGLIFTVWLTRPFDAQFARQMAVESQCQGILLEGEIPSEWTNPATGQVEPKPDAVDWVDVIFHLSDLNIAKGVVSNGAPFVHARDEDGTVRPWPEKAAPLIEDGWAYVTECFVSEAPNATPENTDFFATNALRWPRTQPMIEGWHILDYGDLSRFENVSHWDAGNVLS